MKSTRLGLFFHVHDSHMHFPALDLRAQTLSASWEGPLDERRDGATQAKFLFFLVMRGEHPAKKMDKASISCRYRDG